MSGYIDAIYENGVLRPLSPLRLSEHSLVQISIREAPEQVDRAVLEAQHAAIRQMLAEFARLPLPDNADEVDPREIYPVVSEIMAEDDQRDCLLDGYQ